MPKSFHYRSVTPCSVFESENAPGDVQSLQKLLESIKLENRQLKDQVGGEVTTHTGPKNRPPLVQFPVRTSHGYLTLLEFRL